MATYRSPLKIQAAASIRKIWIESLVRFSRPSRTVWEWVCRFVGQSLNPTAGDCGQPPAPLAERSFGSHCRPNREMTRLGEKSPKALGRWGKRPRARGRANWGRVARLCDEL